MSRQELELAYFRTMQEYMHEVHNTLMMSMSKDISGFTASKRRKMLHCSAIEQRNEIS